MRKNLKRGRKKICLRCLPNIYNFLTENISLTTSKLTQRRLRIYFLGSLQLFKSLFFFHYNKICPLTNYKAIKNKSNKARKYRTQNLHNTYTA